MKLIAKIKFWFFKLKVKRIVSKSGYKGDLALLDQVQPLERDDFIKIVKHGYNIPKAIRFLEELRVTPVEDLDKFLDDVINYEMTEALGKFKSDLKAV